MLHSKGKREERQLSEYSWDYCFPGDEFGYKWTVLVGKERRSQAWMAATVPSKGGTGKFGVDKCLDFIEENGDREGNIIVKNDQEVSMQYLINDLLVERAAGKTVLEESPVKSSSSNGVVERGVQEVEGRIRALYLGLQEKMAVKIDSRERIVAFIPEYAAYLLNRLHVGTDGKVPYERVKGKKPTVMGIEFGEKVLYKIKLGSKMKKLNARWGEGICVGIRRRSNEIMVASREGIMLARSVRRVPLEKRWDKQNLDMVRWAPWHRYGGDENADGDVPEGVPVEEAPSSSKDGERVVFIDTKEKIPREFYIGQKDVSKHGTTRGCGGCSSMVRGFPRQPHNATCRERFREAMRDDAKVIFAENKKRNLQKVKKQEKYAGAKEKKKKGAKEKDKKRDLAQRTRKVDH